MENKRKIATLAVFSELVNNGSNIYDIISKFIMGVINSENLNEFSLEEMAHLFNDKYGTNIPNDIFKTTLKNKLNIPLNNKKFKINNVNDSSESINIQNEQNNIDNTINELYTYIKNKFNNDVSKIEVMKSFNLFVLEPENQDNYTPYISACVIETPNMQQKIASIKEGLLLYTGLTEKIEPNWNNRNSLTIFIDMEILFHAVGYNGEVYKNMFDDFYTLARKINLKNKKIFLKFFNETKKDIDSYFNAAKKIQNKKENPLKTAMKEILKGCNTLSDIITKQANFYAELNQMGIKEDKDFDYFTEKNQSFNILDEELEQKFLKNNYIEDKAIQENKFKVQKCFKYLNFINIRRGNSNPKILEESKYIFLSATGDIFKICYDKNIIEKKIVSLAISLSDITAKFWLKTNNIFENNSRLTYPQICNALIQAQKNVSSLTQSSINKSYKEILAKDNHEYKEILSYMTREVIKPEFINKQNVNDIIDGIKIGYVEEARMLKTIYNNKMKNFEQNEEKYLSEQQLTKKDIQEKDNIIQKLETENKKEIENKNNEIENKNNEIENKNNEIENKNNIIQKLETENRLKETENKKQKRNKKILIGVLYLIFIAVAVWSYVLYFGESLFENILWYVILSAPAVLLFIFKKKK